MIFLLRSLLASLPGIYHLSGAVALEVFYHSISKYPSLRLCYRGRKAFPLIMCRGYFD